MVSTKRWRVCIVVWLLHPFHSKASFLDMHEDTNKEQQHLRGIVKRQPLSTPHVSDKIIQRFIIQNDLKPNTNLSLQNVSENVLLVDGDVIALDDDSGEFDNEIDAVFTDDAKLVVDGMTLSQRPSIRVYQNRDKTISYAKNSDTNRLAWATKRQANGRMSQSIFPLDDDSEIFATVDSKDLDQEASQQHYWYGESSIVSDDFGQRRAALLDNSNETRALAADSVCSRYDVLEIAIAFSSSFCEKYNNSAKRASAAAASVVAGASLLYQQAPLCKRVRVSYMEGYCNHYKDPYQAMIKSSSEVCDPGLLSKFAHYWKTKKQNVRRDAAHLLYGMNDKRFEAMGCAFTQVMCRRDYGYGVAEITFKANPLFRSLVLAHELAHNAGATHIGKNEASSLMKANICLDCDTFSAKSIEQINRHMNNVNCVDPERCQRNADCHDHSNRCRTGKCVGGQCIYEDKLCNDGNKCTDDICRVETGKCRYRWNFSKCSKAPSTTSKTCKRHNQRCAGNCCSGCRCIPVERGRYWYRKGERRERRCKCLNA